MIQDEVHIADLEVTCIVGILPYERHTKQPLIVDASITMNLTSAAVKNDLAFSIDYALLARQIQFVLETGKFELLETAALAVASWLAAPASDGQSYSVAAAEVRIRKPKALGGNGTASVRMKRTSSDIKIESAGDQQEFVFRSERIALLRTKKNDSQAVSSPAGYPYTLDFPGEGPIGLRVAWQRDA